MSRERFHNDLKPYAVLLAGIDADLDNMTDDEVIEMREACEKPTGTNCWFMTFQAARFMAPLLDDKIQGRKLQWPVG